MIVSGQALLEGLLRVAPQGKHRQAKKIRHSNRHHRAALAPEKKLKAIIT